MDDLVTAVSAHPIQDGELLLHETNHRCSNDLQMVVSLLALQSRRASSEETRTALADAMRRVSILAHARSSMWRSSHFCLKSALERVCTALHAQAEPRSIAVSLEAYEEVDGLSDTQVTTLALVANELATNAIKHAFEEGVTGHVAMSFHRDDRYLRVVVDDDGLPFRDGPSDGGGLGMDLVSRLMNSIGGEIVRPQSGSKAFELRLPVGSRSS